MHNDGFVSHNCPPAAGMGDPVAARRRPPDQPPPSTPLPMRSGVAGAPVPWVTVTVAL
jgi:hypothetical protein